MTRYAWRAVGAVGGYALAGIAGAILGFVCGVLLDHFLALQRHTRRVDRFLMYPERESDPGLIRRWGTAALVVEAMNADGIPHPEQVARATEHPWPLARNPRGRRGLSPRDRRLLLERVFTARGESEVHRIAAAMAAHLDGEEAGRLVEFLVRVAIADGKGVSVAERQMIAAVAGRLPFDGRLPEVERRSGGLDSGHCAVLGVEPTATIDDVRRVYRRLATDLHPDTAGALDETQRDELNRALARVHIAYEALSRQLAARASADDSLR